MLTIILNQVAPRDTNIILREAAQLDGSGQLTFSGAGGLSGAAAGAQASGTVTNPTPIIGGGVRMRPSWTDIPVRPRVKKLKVKAAALAQPGSRIGGCGTVTLPEPEPAWSEEEDEEAVFALLAAM